jgi:hypothetical protein
VPEQSGYIILLQIEKSLFVLQSACFLFFKLHWGKVNKVLLDKRAISQSWMGHHTASHPPEISGQFGKQLPCRVLMELDWLRRETEI